MWPGATTFERIDANRVRTSIEHFVMVEHGKRPSRHNDLTGCVMDEVVREPSPWGWQAQLPATSAEEHLRHLVVRNLQQLYSQAD